MFKRINFTPKQYKDTSLVFFIISGFMLFGSIIAGLMEGFDKSLVSTILLMITSFILGFVYRRNGQKGTK